MQAREAGSGALDAHPCGGAEWQPSGGAAAGPEYANTAWSGPGELLPAAPGAACAEAASGLGAPHAAALIDTGGPGHHGYPAQPQGPPAALAAALQQLYASGAIGLIGALGGSAAAAAAAGAARQPSTSASGGSNASHFALALPHRVLRPTHLQAQPHPSASQLPQYEYHASHSMFIHGGCAFSRPAAPAPAPHQAPQPQPQPEAAAAATAASGGQQSGGGKRAAPEPAADADGSGGTGGSGGSGGREGSGGSGADVSRPSQDGGSNTPGPDASSLAVHALPADLAHLRKRIKIIQPISSAWQEEALRASTGAGDGAGT
ncbi:hypothetical protein MNEG_7853, partial [Monoraphidium neglectum]